MIRVIDLRANNAASVCYALRRLGASHGMAHRPGDLVGASAIVLPGVGSARGTMQALAERGLQDAMEDAILGRGIPYLGICVGLQVLFEHTEEEDTRCLGWIAGSVERFPEDCRVPQIGWNRVDFSAREALSQGLRASEHCYFANSFFAKPADPAIIHGRSNYGVSFCALLRKDNVSACQFHVEKSGPVGMTILRNWVQAADRGSLASPH